MFVESKDPDVVGYGIGKLVDANESSSVIQYFISPADDPVEITVDSGTVCEFDLATQERIFFREDGSWRVGRLEDYFGPDELLVRLPNQEHAHVSVADAFVRSNLPLKSPLPLLCERSTETPFWHEGRSAFVRALADQRAVYRGLAALASSNVEMFLHQLTIVDRILNDPVPRYLLADEVGLGKTVEACLVIRQHLMDEPDEALVLVVVPENLVQQWQTELQRRFRLKDEEPVFVVGHGELDRWASSREPLTLLVIDEAHEVAVRAGDDGEAGSLYRSASRLVRRSAGVLLLSATPVLHNEDTFLAMLHLLDPEAHRLENVEGFRRLVAHREVVASAIRDLEDDATGFLLEPALDDLRPLCESSAMLARHVDEVAHRLDDDPDDPARSGAISTLRTHLEECYRLDRRLLRTRRAQTYVKDDLPRRTHVLWELKDAARSEVFEWLDQWRFSAADADDRAAATVTFLEFIEAALAHPERLTSVVDQRKALLGRGDREYFPDEVAYLRRVPRYVVEQDARVDALADLIEQGGRRAKWVVFVSDPAVADTVARKLRARVMAVRLAVDTDANETLGRFRDEGDTSVLVCDRDSELGLNLQEFGANLVHFDLPLSPNRIEQRIGRLDRLAGGRNEVASYVPVVATRGRQTNYESAWARCLLDAVKVFDRSVASLQHTLDAGRTRLEDTVLDGGIDALDDLREAWMAEKGPLSLSAELHRVQAQDLLDQLENELTEHYYAIEDYEYATDPSLAERFSKDVAGWAMGSLGFWIRSKRDDENVVEFETARRTLLAANHLARLFGHSLRYRRRRRGLSTGLMAFDRDDAVPSALPIARIGHPFIDDLERLTEWDDRGRAYAFWRSIDGYEARFSPGNPEDLYFRFDYLVTVDIAISVECARVSGLSVGAVQRRAEEALPPRYVTIWTDLQGERVTSAELLDELGRPYSNTDVNLRPPRWNSVDEWGLVADWSRVCQDVESSARSHLVEAVDLESVVARAMRHVTERHQSATRQLEARMSMVEYRAGEERALDVERRLYECLRRAIETPRLRLDSAGAVFVSEKNPFEE